MAFIVWFELIRLFICICYEYFKQKLANTETKEQVKVLEFLFFPSFEHILQLFHFKAHPLPMQGKHVSRKARL